MMIRPTGKIKVDFRIAKINYIKNSLTVCGQGAFILIIRLCRSSFCRRQIIIRRKPIIILPQANHHSRIAGLTSEHRLYHPIRHLGRISPMLNMRGLFAIDKISCRCDLADVLVGVDED